MSRNSKLISENLREEIAKELGVYDQVKKDGGSWENVSSKTCGNIVTKAIEIANRSVENKEIWKIKGNKWKTLFPFKNILQNLINNHII